MYKMLQFNKKKNTTPSGQFQNSIEEKGKIDTPNTKAHDHLTFAA